MHRDRKSPGLVKKARSKIFRAGLHLQVVQTQAFCYGITVLDAPIPAGRFCSEARSAAQPQMLIASLARNVQGADTQSLVALPPFLCSALIAGETPALPVQRSSCLLVLL
jgi:hypothetical protein